MMSHIYRPDVEAPNGLLRGSERSRLWSLIATKNANTIDVIKNFISKELDKKFPRHVTLEVGLLFYRNSLCPYTCLGLVALGHANVWSQVRIVACRDKLFDPHRWDIPDMYAKMLLHHVLCGFDGTNPLVTDDILQQTNRLMNVYEFDVELEGKNHDILAMNKLATMELKMFRECRYLPVEYDKISGNEGEESDDHPEDEELYMHDAPNELAGAKELKTLFSSISKTDGGEVLIRDFRAYVTKQYMEGNHPSPPVNIEDMAWL